MRKLINDFRRNSLFVKISLIGSLVFGGLVAIGNVVENNRLPDPDLNSKWERAHYTGTFRPKHDGISCRRMYGDGWRQGSFLEGSYACVFDLDDDR